MPIYRLLQNAAFGPEEILLIVSAYEATLSTLNVDRDDPVSKTVAKKVFEIAQTGERDPVKVRTQALESFGVSHPAVSANTDLDQGAEIARSDNIKMEWKPIATAPFDCDLELAVIDYDGVHALAFSCRRHLHGWTNAKTKKHIDDLRPTHWREWRGS